MKDDIHKLTASEKIARVTFFVFWFFIFFGTSLPFRETVTNVDDKTSSNFFNQVVYIAMFMTSCYSLSYNPGAVWMFIKREMFLFCFLAWCLISICWSEFGFVSFKKLFQLVTTVTVCLAALLTTRNSIEIFRHFKYILILYLGLTVLAIAFVPAAQDPQSMSWRGLATSKNHLGQVCAVSTLVWFYSFRLAKGFERVFSAVMLFLCLGILAGTMAATSILTLAVLFCMGSVVYITKRIMPLKIARPFAGAMIISGIALCLGTFLAHPDLFRSLLIAMNRDPTFTGRTDLWLYIYNEAVGHLTVGCGYGGFWVPWNADVLFLYKDFVWLPNQAHMGYLDILNETGLVGLMLLAGMLTLYLKNSRKLVTLHFWHWFLIAALIINLQETTLFRPKFLTGTMFIFAYIAMYTDLLFQEELQKESATHNQFHRIEWSKEAS